MIKVIGNGLIGTSIREKLRGSGLIDITVVASGVSSSVSASKMQCERERDLIKEIISRSSSEELLVYISTCSIYSEHLVNSPYVHHKIQMELLFSRVKRLLIVRLPQVVGLGGNQTSLCNWVHNLIMENKPITVFRGAIRNIIDVEDVSEVLLRHLKRGDSERRIISIANRRNCTIENLIDCFENVLSKKAIQKIGENIPKGSYKIINNIVENEDLLFKRKFSENYLLSVIRKYYGSSPVS
jgi:nucleoside-diphosphate-sugar epimerase